MRDVGTSSGARAARLACLALLSCTNDIRFTPQVEPLGAAGASTQGPVGPAGSWEPSFAEECDGPLDANRINTFMPNAAGQPIHLWTPRGEYIDERNVSSAAGDCVITVRHEAIGGREYSAGTLNTAGHFEQHGGYFEARFWPPAGVGFWTFWWLRAADADWPPAIELFNFSMNEPHYTAQFYDPSGNQHSGGVDSGDVTTGYHTAGVEWTDTELLFYFDGAMRFRTSEDVPNLVEPMYAKALAAHVEPSSESPRLTPGNAFGARGQSSTRPPTSSARRKGRGGCTTRRGAGGAAGGAAGAARRSGAVRFHSAETSESTNSLGSDSSGTRAVTCSPALVQLSVAARVSQLTSRSPEQHELLGSSNMLVNDRIASAYGLAAAGAGAALVARPVPSERLGFLTHPAFMALQAKPTRGDPIHRGLFVREQLLCNELPDPPVTDKDGNPIVFNVGATGPGITNRQRFKEHTASAECAACHTLIDPLGFGFENYDALGRFRTTDENGIAIDASGDVLGDNDATGPFNGGSELVARLSQSKTVAACMTVQWFRYALSRDEAREDACALASVQARFSETGGNLKEMLIALTASDAFRFRKVGAK